MNDALDDLVDTANLLYAKLEDEDIDWGELDIEEFLTETIPEIGRRIEQQSLDKTLRAAVRLDPNNATGIRGYLVSVGAVQDV